MSVFKRQFKRHLFFEPSLTRIKEALEIAQKAMPPAPEGCKVCLLV